MKEQNSDIRRAIETAGVKKYQVAHEIGVSDGWFSKLLRYELPAEKKAEIMKAIERVKREA